MAAPTLNLTLKSKKNEKKGKVFEARIRIEKQSKLSEVVATTLTSRSDTGPAGLAAVVPSLPPRGRFLVYSRICVPFFTYKLQWLNSLRCSRLKRRVQNKTPMKRTERSTILGANWRLAK